MNERTATNWSHVPGNPWMICMVPQMLLPGGVIKNRLYRGAITQVSYDRSYVVAKLAHSLREFKGLKNRHWQDLMKDVAEAIGIDASEQ